MDGALGARDGAYRPGSPRNQEGGEGHAGEVEARGIRFLCQGVWGHRLQKKFAQVLRTEERSEALEERDIAESALAWLQQRAERSAGGRAPEEVVEKLAGTMVIPPQFTVPPDLGDELPWGEYEEPIPVEEAAAEVVGEEPRKAKFIVVTVGRSCRSLHKAVDGCWMGRSKVFRSAVEFEEKPGEEEYTHVCKVCWPPRKLGVEASESSGDSSSSSSSDSSEGTSAARRSAQEGWDREGKIKGPGKAFREMVASSRGG